MMKKITIILITLLFTGSIAIAQSQRMVLAEESTSSTCGPCAGQNPAFDALLQANSDIVTAIKYHVWWPAPGNDPMYLHNTVDNAARTNYYGINSVPRAVMEGSYYNGQPASVSQNMLNTLAAVPSPFEIQIQQELSPDEDSIYLTTLIKATEDVAGNMFAHVVVVEKHIEFSSAPGTNGEKDFFNVMKKLLPSKSGTSMPSSMLAGDYIILQNSWKLENVYDINELGAVAFVQDNTSKDVHQAGNSSVDPLIPAYNLDAQILSVSNTTSTNCGGVVTPSITIRNNGGAELTSLIINYSMNEGDPQTYMWEGNLGFLESEKVDLTPVFFAIADTNELIINGLSPNGETDDYTPNNTYIFEVLKAPNLFGTSIVFLTLDDHPEETTWEIRNSQDDVVQSGGPYETSGQKFEPITVSETDCYEFIIYDAGGNGTEYYAVVYGNNQVAFDGSNFGDLERNEFAIGTVSVNQIEAYTDMSIYPNPASDKLNISFYMPDQNDVQIFVTDIAGKAIMNKQEGILNAGPQQLIINTSKLTPGFYVVEILIGHEVYSQKISVQ